MPAAVAVGGDPAVIYAANGAAAGAVDEMLLPVFCGGTRRDGQVHHLSIEVPAGSELVIEGYPIRRDKERRPRRPHRVYSAGSTRFFMSPVSTHRRTHISATIVGKPPWKTATTAQRIFLPLIRLDSPRSGNQSAMEGVFHNAALISIKKSYPATSNKIIHGLWGRADDVRQTPVIVDEMSMSRTSYMLASPNTLTGGGTWSLPRSLMTRPAASFPRYARRWYRRDGRKTREEA